MKNLSKLLLAGIISIGIFYQAAQATTITPTDDLYVEESIANLPSENSDFLFVDSAFFFESRNITYLKFNTAPLAGFLNGSENLNSASLKLFYDLHDSLVLPMLFYVSNDNWNENDGIFSDTLTPFESLGGIAVGTDNQLDSSIEFDLFDYLKDIDSNTKAELLDGAISFAIKYDFIEDFEIPTTIFKSKEFLDGEFAPELIIETTPVPEPSSILLGLLGLSGAFNLKRKK